MKYLNIAVAVLSLLLIAEGSRAQDLDPRAYARIPVNVTVVVAGFGYSNGGIVTDATVPVDDLQAKIGSPSLGVVHSFSSSWPYSPGLSCSALCLGRGFRDCINVNRKAQHAPA